MSPETISGFDLDPFNPCVWPFGGFHIVVVNFFNVVVISHFFVFIALQKMCCFFFGQFLYRIMFWNLESTRCTRIDNFFCLIVFFTSDHQTFCNLFKVRHVIYAIYDICSELLNEVIVHPSSIWLQQICYRPLRDRTRDFQVVSHLP